VCGGDGSGIQAPSTKYQTQQKEFQMKLYKVVNKALKAIDNPIKTEFSDSTKAFIKEYFAGPVQPPHELLSEMRE